MQETVGNAGTGSENRNYGYGKCPEELWHRKHLERSHIWQWSIAWISRSKVSLYLQKLRELQGI